MNNDQKIMEDLLLTTKGVCDLYLHGAIESDTPNVHQTFDSALAKVWICSRKSTVKCPLAAGIRPSKPTLSRLLRFAASFPADRAHSKTVRLVAGRTVFFDA